ncbi:MAG: DMT family transporter [Promethearchaeota archaeon]
MLGEVIAIFAVLTFVGSNVLFRKTEHEASPTFINFFRTAVGTITFVIIVLIINQFDLLIQIPWELWIILILSFVFGQVIGDTAYFSAQKELGTTIALAISMTFPLFTFILSLIFLDRSFKLNLLLSLLLIGVGITIIGKSKTGSEYSEEVEKFQNQKISSLQIFNKTIIKAIIFCLTAALGWAVGAVMIEIATDKIEQIIQIKELTSIIGNVIRFPFALLILSSMVLRENYFKKINNTTTSQNKSLRTYIILLVASIIGTSIGSYLYTESVHIATANVVALIASAAPLFALPLTYIINKETITKFGFIGVILTILGVVIILI